LPNDGPHVIEAYGLAKAYNLGTNWNHLIPSIVHGTSELIADVDAQPTTWLEDALAFFPNKIEIVDVRFVAVMKTDLIF